MSPGGAFVGKIKKAAKKFLSLAKNASIMSRDARISNPGAETVRQLYKQGDNLNAKDLAGAYLLSSAAGVTLPIAPWLVGVGGDLASLGMAAGGLAGAEAMGSVAMANASDSSSDIPDLQIPSNNYSNNYSIPPYFQTGDTVLFPTPKNYAISDTIPSSEVQPYSVLKGGKKVGSDYLSLMEVIKDDTDSTGVSYSPYIVNKEKDMYIPLGVDFEQYKKDTYPRQKGMGYIGGNSSEARNKFLQVSGLLPIIKDLSTTYNIDPNLVAHRFAKEGFVDHYIKEYNYAGSKEALRKLLSELLQFNNGAYSAYGMDTLLLRVLNGSVKLKNQDLFNKIKNMEASQLLYKLTNEKGDASLDGMLLPAEAAEIMSAYFSYLNERYRPAFDALTKYNGISNWSTLANAMYNLGENNNDLRNSNWVNLNYAVPNYYKSGGKLNYLNLIGNGKLVL